MFIALRKILIPFFILLVIAYTASSYSMSQVPPHTYNPVRVSVLKDVSKLILRIKGPYEIVDFNSGESIEKGKSLRSTKISVKNIASKGMKILPGVKSRIYINDRQFRGNIDIIKDKEKNSLFVVNHIDVEEYLYGVLYHEVSHRWPIEVLKAQAITARTYALYQKLVTKNKYFDLVSNVYSQVYGGRTSEKGRTTKAVNLTMGQVLTYDGKIFPTYYHATCGGKTTDADTLWNIKIPTLIGRICNFCKYSPHYKWKKELDLDYFSIKIMERDKSGRVLNLLLKNKDKETKITGNKFRLMIGPNIIKSTNFEIKKRGKYFVFQGKGWGHGIGMCQWGAYGMSRKGWAVEKILKHYYPGSELAIWEQK